MTDDTNTQDQLKGEPMTQHQSEWPRRASLQRLTPAERAICDAVQAVEAMPADVRLTDAVVLLQAARESVADFVDGIHVRRSVSPDTRDDAERQNVSPTPDAALPRMVAAYFDDAAEDVAQAIVMLQAAKGRIKNVEAEARRLSSLQTDIAALRDALAQRTVEQMQPYLQHHYDCRVQNTDTTPVCDCGLATILVSGRAGKQEV